jgi:hypothetical protein
MGRVAAIILALALGLGSAFLVACGDRNNLIPRSDASAINQQLDSVASAVAARDCGVADSAVSVAERRAQSLPSQVDRKLRRTLQDNLGQLASVAQAQCTKSATTRSTQSTATTPSTPSTESTATTTTQTTTTTPPTRTVPPPSTPSTDTGQSGGVGPGTGGGGAQRSPQD